MGRTPAVWCVVWVWCADHSHAQICSCAAGLLPASCAAHWGFVFLTTPKGGSGQMARARRFTLNPPRPAVLCCAETLSQVTGSSSAGSSGAGSGGTAAGSSRSAPAAHGAAGPAAQQPRQSNSTGAGAAVGVGGAPHPHDATAAVLPIGFVVSPWPARPPLPAAGALLPPPSRPGPRASPGLDDRHPAVVYEEEQRWRRQGLAHGGGASMAHIGFCLGVGTPCLPI